MTSEPAHADDVSSFAARRWRRPTIYDVALQAGVSTTTVMRVVQNASYGVSEKTRRHVRGVIDSVGFVPNPVARALATRRSRRIGIIIDGAESPSANITVAALERVARERGFSTAVSTIADGDARSLPVAVLEMMSRGIDGMIVIASRTTTIAGLHQTNLPLPTLTVTSGPVAAEVKRVGTDQRAGAHLAVRHLASSGNRSIAHLGGPWNSRDARERHQGWREASVSLGLDLGPELAGEWSSDFGYAAARQLDIKQTRAIFAASDRIAIGVLHALHERGLRVPEDVEVVGYDDIPEAQYLSPPLTTIRHNYEALARCGLSTLVSLVDGVKTEDGQGAIEGGDDLGPALVPRASTKRMSNVG